mmetsp:Transcript_10863/g.18171  ORF Transcript_10863/g.18171 Transcript_10863/m.18171 type:complete len:266 (-) Transcript_10863:693-1490(-)
MPCSTRWPKRRCPICQTPTTTCCARPCRCCVCSTTTGRCSPCRPATSRAAVWTRRQSLRRLLAPATMPTSTPLRTRGAVRSSATTSWATTISAPAVWTTATRWPKVAGALTPSTTVTRSAVVRRQALAVIAAGPTTISTVSKVSTTSSSTVAQRRAKARNPSRTGCRRPPVRRAISSGRASRTSLPSTALRARGTRARRCCTRKSVPCRSRRCVPVPRASGLQRTPPCPACRRRQRSCRRRCAPSTTQPPPRRAVASVARSSAYS